MKRREFIQTAALAAAGTALVLPAFSLPASKYRIGLQLYALRDVIGKDPKGVVKMVADLGYQDLEAYGYDNSKLFGLASKEFAGYVKSLGMRLTSGHYQLGKNGEEQIDKRIDSQRLGTRLCRCQRSGAGVHGDRLSQCRRTRYIG